MKKIICARVWGETFAPFVSNQLPNSLEVANSKAAYFVVELLLGMKQGIADTATSRKIAEE